MKSFNGGFTWLPLIKEVKELSGNLVSVMETMDKSEDLLECGKIKQFCKIHSFYCLFEWDIGQRL